jgi:hypothetical protein
MYRGGFLKYELKLLTRSVEYSMIWKNIILEIIENLEKIYLVSEKKDISRKNFLKLLKILEILND